MIKVYEYNIGGITAMSGEIYNRNLTDGNFSISDLYIRIRSDTVSISEASININKTNYSAEITTNGNKQLLTFLSNTPITIFNVNELEDLDVKIYNYAFTLIGSNLKTYSMNKNIIYNFNRYSDVGDINGDGYINILDVVALSRGVISRNCKDIEGGHPCDLTNDGGYNILDITTLANSILSGSVKHG